MKLFSKFTLLAALFMGLVAIVNAQPALYVEGTHYETIASPVRTADPNKIEVTEIFYHLTPCVPTRRKHNTPIQSHH
jgi:hypothetical protein